MLIHGGESGGGKGGSVGGGVGGGVPRGGVALPGLVGNFSSFLNEMANKREQQKEAEMEIYGHKVHPSIGTHF